MGALQGREPVWILRPGAAMRHTDPWNDERGASTRGSLASTALHYFYALLRWIAGHVRGFHAAVGALLLIGLAVIAGAVAAFAGLAALMQSGATQHIDDAVLLWLNAHATPTLDLAALEVTSLGSGTVVWVILLISSAFLWTTGHRYSVLLLFAAMLGGSILNLQLKAEFGRPRPELFPWRTTQVGHSSFPSGHALTAVVLYATLAYLIGRLQTTRVQRRLTLLVALLIILLIGLSRLYLGVHYPSDVLAGFVVGIAWSTVCALAIEALRYFFGRRHSGPL
jgi:undecaprenyl-diphosphatase